MLDIIIWKSDWLAGSETFVRNQTNALGYTRATPVGTRRIDSGLSEDTDIILFTRSRVDKLKLAAFEKTGYSRRVVREFRRRRPALIHAHFANEGMVIRQSARRAEIPLVVTLHGSDITAGPRQTGVRGIYYRRRLRRVFRSARLIIAVSQHIADLAILLGAPAEKVVVHHIGIPLARRESLTPGAVSASVLMVGRMIEKKGFADAIRAMAQLPVPLRQTPITLIGDGPLHGELERLSRELGVNARFLGFLPAEDVRAAMRERPIVCVPSIRASNGDEEGLPTVVMEAGSEACAIVATRHSGIPDAVEDHENGLLVSEGDVAGLARAIASLLEHPDEADRLGRRARNTVYAQFDITTQTRALEELYARVSAPR